MGLLSPPVAPDYRLASGAGDAPGLAVGSGVARKPGFLFTGEGSQWPGMGRELYESEPVFRAVLDRCDEEMAALRGESLLDVMFGAAAGPDLDNARWAQPALFSLESGLAALWAGVGVTPSAVSGRGVGEIAAAHAAGSFTLEDGLRFAASRGELMDSLSPSPEFHVDAILDELEGLLERVTVSPLRLPLVSSGSGRVMEAGEVLDGLYWRRQARGTVAFQDAVGALASLGVDVLVEVGPQPVLGVMATAAWPVGSERVGGRPPAASSRPATPGRTGVQWPVLPADDEDRAPAVLSSLRRDAAEDGGSSARGAFVEAVAGAYVAGLDLCFEGLFTGEERRRVSLPGYPFQRRRYWVDPPKP